MKIDLKNRTNKNAIKSIRSQIKSNGNLRKFDEFIAKHEVFDVSNNDHMKAAQGCCNPWDDIDISKCTLPPVKLE